MTLQEIVAGVQAHQPEAWEELYTRFYRRLVAMLCGRFTMNLDLAEDIAADTILDAVQQIRNHEIRDAQALPAYLWIIAKRKTILGHKHTHKAAQLEHLPAEVRHSIEAARAIHPQEPSNGQIERVKAAIASLRLRDRQILEKFYLQGLPKELIMQQMGLRESEFRQYKTRAVTTIAAAVHGIDRHVKIDKRKMRMVRRGEITCIRDARGDGERWQQP